MKALPITLTLTAVLTLQPAIAAEERSRAIEQFSCKEVMRERGPDRDVAIAFLHGFLLAKSGVTKVDLGLLHKQSDAFIERCLDNPAESALEAMTKVKR